MRVDGRARAQVVDPDEAGRRLQLGQVAPPEELAWCVDYCWWVAWDTADPYDQEVVPRPVVHVAAEVWEGEPRLVVTGVPTESFHRRLEGQGRSVALAFRPGGFRPFVNAPASRLVDVTAPLEPVVGVDDREVAGRLLDPRVEVERAGEELLVWFAGMAPPPDPAVDEVTELVETAESDTTIRRAEDLAALAGVSLRTLQRRFREYVGPGPKWVVQRYRLLDVVKAANAGEEIDWAGLAAELGYADQSHLIRHFRQVVGEPPARYAARQGGPEAPARARP